jgi:hypothetical protein
MRIKQFDSLVCKTIPKFILHIGGQSLETSEDYFRFRHMLRNVMLRTSTLAHDLNLNISSPFRMLPQTYSSMNCARKIELTILDNVPDPIIGFIRH